MRPVLARFFPVLILAGVLFAACGDDDDSIAEPVFGDVELVFKGQWDGEPLVMFKNYPYAFGENIQFSKSDFYLANFTLTSEDGDTNILDVEMIDLSFSNEADAREGLSLKFNDVKGGTYNGFQFTIGLDEEMNSGRPEDYTSSSPLSLPRYWEPWTSYIFAKYEGKLDTLGNGDFGLSWAYHTGTDAYAANLKSDISYEIEEDESLKIEFYLDHMKLFGVDDEPIDIKVAPQNHNPKDTVRLKKISDNYSKALSFVIETE